MACGPFHGRRAHLFRLVLTETHRHSPLNAPAQAGQAFILEVPAPIEGKPRRAHPTADIHAYGRGNDHVLTGQHCAHGGAYTPVHIGHGGEVMKQVSPAAMKWAARHLRPSSIRAPLGKQLLEKARLQLGTLGGGNHFIEVCYDEEDCSWVMLHSGSRHIGKQVADHYIGQAKLQLKEAGRLRDLPDANLAYFTEGGPGFQDYLADLYWAQDYARFNRRQIMHAILEQIAALRSRVEQQRLGGSQGLVRERVECHHNYVSKEVHFGREVYVTRKGALSAARGEFAVIPGSMGAASYVVEGKGNPESFSSCAHGAGRSMSRTEAKRRFTVGDLARQTEGVDCRKDKGVLDEIPAAYKDIEDVMAQQQDLVSVRHRLRQMLCVKG